ncbi:MAG TPA: hypothetical protein VF193_11670 [Steroidobacter sp.]
MTPADRRIAELIDKWLVSVELHLQYVELSDAAYARVQPWPKHDRPTRWVLEVARQKILELKEHWETRQAIGDSKFSESLELMAFLANLVGIQHIQRFIPLADPARADTAASGVVPQPPAAPAPPRPTPQNTAPARPPRPQTDDSTREMPRLKPIPARPAAPAKAAPAAKPRSEPAKAPARAAPAAARAAAPRTAAAAGKAVAAAAPRTVMTPDLQAKIIADAVRLLKWGRVWHELADLIARIAERPPANEIRKVLRAHRAEIEQRAAAKS